MAGDKLSLGDLAAAVVADDEAIRDELKGLVEDMIKHMRFTMRHGEPSTKIQLSKQIIPQLLTAINRVDADEGEAEEKAAYQRMMAALRGDAPADREPALPSEATTDAPNPAPAPVAKPVTKKPAKKPAKKIAKKIAAKVAVKKTPASKPARKRAAKVAS